EQFRRSVAATAATIGILVVGLGVSNRAWVAIGSLTGLALVLTSRYLWRQAIDRRRKSGRLAIRTLVIGSNEDARRLADVVRAEPAGYEVVGFVQTHAMDPGGLPGPGTSDLADLEKVIRRRQAECLFVALSALTSSEA